jgi:hypothetical protein
VQYDLEDLCRRYWARKQWLKKQQQEQQQQQQQKQGQQQGQVQGEVQCIGGVEVVAVGSDTQQQQQQRLKAAAGVRSFATLAP